jgi:predicted deacylase
MGIFSRNGGLNMIHVPGSDAVFPLFEKNGTPDPGPALVITAGMDGDEYDGIDAAYRLIGELKTADFVGRVTVIPVSNPAGYYNETSRNPEDRAFPKHVYPGDYDGTASEKLLATIRAHALSGADAWIDLHGGSLTERLDPYVWTYRTGTSRVDAVILAFLGLLTDDTAVYEKTSWRKPGRIARDGTAYMISEAGDGSGRSESAVAVHVRRVQTLMAALGMTAKPPRGARPADIYTKTAYAVAPFDGCWYPDARTAVSLDGRRRKTVRFPEGRTLWTHSGMAVRRHDIVGAVAYEKAARIS